MNFENKTYYIAGVANKKSVATFVAKTLIASGAKIIFSAQNQNNLEQIQKIFPDSDAFIHNVESKDDLATLHSKIANYTDKLDGILHSIAFANFSDGPVPFHQTKREDFLQAVTISSFSLVEMTNALLPLLVNDASIVTISISNTLATSYGYLGPIKAMLDTTVAYLAKSLSQNTNIRVNAVQAGPLKTSASAGIPNYLENYFFSEALTMRKKSLSTQEVANTACFLLNEISSGINAGGIRIDAGMQANYFDQDVVKAFAKDI